MGRIDLYWLPLGAGGHSVRFNGRVYEALKAGVERRPRQDLYHSALEVRVDGERVVIEMAPAWSVPEADRGVVVEGPVGAAWAGRWRLLRYEIRRWSGGRIPDAAEAIDSPRRLSDDDGCARRLLELVPDCPPIVWGRDELGTGDMWNCNSVVAWLLASSGVDVSSIRLPDGGRAPGWQAGLALALKQPVRPLQVA